MPESTTPAFAWPPTKVPPLQADYDRIYRRYRRSVKAVERAWGFSAAALVGFAVGAATALYTCTGALV